jgi:GT2 family glycosyltransferase
MEKDSEVAYFCGAGFAMRRQVFLDMEGFWELLAYGGEELDLSYRLMTAGYQLVYAPSIEVAHYEVPTARPKGQWVYFQTRNRCWIAVRNLPWHFALSTTFLWWAYIVWVSFKHRELKFFIKGVRDALAGLSFALHQRQRIREPAIIRIKILSGRLWY